MWKRNQSMMAELAKSSFVNKMTFVNPPMWIGNIWGGRGKFEIKRDNLDLIYPKRRLEKVWSYTPIYFPFSTKLGLVKELEKKMMKYLMLNKAKGAPYVFFLNSPYFPKSEVVDDLLAGAELSIFDFSDDFVELVHAEDRKVQFKENIKKYASSVDIVLSVNQHIKDKYSHLNPNFNVVPNATNYENFNNYEFLPLEQLEVIKTKYKAIIGYHGWINKSRIDFQLVEKLFTELKDYGFVFVGPVEESFRSRFGSFENLKLFPAVDYQKLPNYLRYFDIAIIPFLLNEHTRGNHLLKFYDYLALGKPVVSTNVAGAAQLNSVISIANNQIEFIEYIRQEIEIDSDVKKLARKQVAKQNSWSVRVSALVKLIEENLDLKYQQRVGYE